MCFGGGGDDKPTPAPAPAPPPPAPLAEETDPTAPRKAEDKANYDSTTPSLRVDRSTTSGGVGAGGSGLRM
ncbi:hypothetical protein [Methylobacterium ajmalii]|jgi:hypothetical protein|uniref:hypothetical protein n=1 Tax=Methylobacterium ajmalii TaxID=2738439 RepID=UPI00190A6C1A|nr:hypothetical protein [Methylobacterium ajmalii]MBK3400431.1 hypothetical protein [Methylobacterium ajmalii]MBK3407527.1 hypothetical protein [Methylobacterium ajmalii]MBK3422125.1 hypothetical protein [Methylobacterium ajmalii]